MIVITFAEIPEHFVTKTQSISMVYTFVKGAPCSCWIALMKSFRDDYSHRGGNLGGHPRATIRWHMCMVQNAWCSRFLRENVCAKHSSGACNAARRPPRESLLYSTQFYHFGRLLVGILGDRADSTSVYGIACSARVVKALAADKSHGSQLHW